MAKQVNLLLSAMWRGQMSKLVTENNQRRRRIGLEFNTCIWPKTKRKQKKKKEERKGNPQDTFKLSSPCPISYTVLQMTLFTKIFNTLSTGANV